MVNNTEQHPEIDYDIAGNTRRIMVSIPDEAYGHENTRFTVYLTEALNRDGREGLQEKYGIHSWVLPEEDDEPVTIEIEVQHIGDLLADYAAWVAYTLHHYTGVSSGASN